MPLEDDNMSVCRCGNDAAGSSGSIFFLSPVATPICSIVNLVAVRSVLFFDMELIIWSIDVFLAWLPERQLWGTLGICINPRWRLWTPGLPPDGISFY